MSRTPTPDEAQRDTERAAADARDVDFWETRAGLRFARDWARARRASPYAVLGEILAGTIGRIQPAVQLPALVGGPGSLNLLEAAVGPSGEGKGAAASCVREAVEWGDRDLTLVMIGSGEGIERTFGVGVKDKLVGYSVRRTQWRAMFVAHEVDQVAALMARKGATLSPTLRQLYSGEELGHGNAEPERRVIIPRHQYRAVAIIGVQPGRGEALLGDADGGLPQRFLWLPTTDPDLPDHKPDDPPRIQWRMPDELAIASALGAPLSDNDVKPMVMELCELARTTIDQARVARMRGDGDALDGHALYTCEKTAAGLALYDGRLNISEEDWQLAGHLMAVSNRTRERIAEALRRAGEQQNENRGRMEARRHRIVTDAAEQEQLRKTENRIMSVLREHKAWMAHAELRKRLSSAQRDCFPEAIERLLKEELVSSRSTAQGHGATGTEYRTGK